MRRLGDVIKIISNAYPLCVQRLPRQAWPPKRSKADTLIPTLFPDSAHGGGGAGVANFNQNDGALFPVWTVRDLNSATYRARRVYG